MDPSGFLLIDKPAHMTSHDVVDALRRLTGVRRIGHAGTLDPFATGLLIVGVGKDATTRLSSIVGLDKTYDATFVLGATSTTDDPEGVVTISPLLPLALPLPEWEREEVGVGMVALTEAMQSFLGETQQIPPQYAAIKINGKKMYELAREGKVIDAKPRRVRIDAFMLTQPPVSTPDGQTTLQVRIHCGSGTYIRALARDLGAKLGIGGYVNQLRRTSIGQYDVNNATTLDALQREDWSKSLTNLALDQKGKE